ncbi:MAG: hypothetical protein J6B15_05000 [Muribaculaceae bacterium]|nr:hypothetical protein [Muribaculaceae bacterium]
MGSSPRTKSEIRERIADLQGQIARQQALPKSYASKQCIASARAEIAQLRAKLPDAPKE